MELIDREKLLKKKKYLFRTDGGCFPKSEWFIKMEHIFNAPTVDATPAVHGRWRIAHGMYNDRYYCNECGHTLGIIGQVPVGKYCPNCGAKMDGEIIDDERA